MFGIGNRRSSGVRGGDRGRGQFGRPRDSPAVDIDHLCTIVTVSYAGGEEGGGGRRVSNKLTYHVLKSV